MGSIPDRMTDPIPKEPLDRLPEPGMALCLSGGGFRAMLFHVGALWRLNELGYIPKLKRISSVSGGSITAAYLGLKWRDLDFDSNGVSRMFVAAFVAGIRELANRTVDIGAVMRGILGPKSIADQMCMVYRKRLFADATLQSLPDEPRFVINASNVQSGALWRFMKPYMRDWRVGEVRDPEVLLGVAVAASSAFPPFLSPLTMRLHPTQFTDGSGADLQREPFTSRVLLTDGGVYDNLGLETAVKRFDTILVSDAGGKLSFAPKPKNNWLSHTLRVLDVIDNQVRSLRKRDLIERYCEYQRLKKDGHDEDSVVMRRVARKGAYWGIRSNIDHYHVPDALECPHKKTMALANINTRLARLSTLKQERLINWGYAVCDAAIRKHVDTTVNPPKGFPYRAGVG